MGKQNSNSDQKEYLKSSIYLRSTSNPTSKRLNKAKRKYPQTNKNINKMTQN